MAEKIKRRLPALLVVLLAILFVPGTANAKTAKEYQQSRWNFKQTLKKSSGAFTYYAYPSKNRKEAWIYKIKIKGGKNCSKLSIPSSLDNKKVTRLGARLPKGDDMYNIFGGAAEPYHGVDAGPKAISRIKKLTIPNTVEIIQPLAFCGMDSVKTVKVPKKVRSLEEYTFYGCDSLKNIELPAGMKNISVYAFDNCPKLAKIKLPSNNKTYQVKGKCLITKKKKELVFALTGGQTFQIPEGVETIKTHAFCSSGAETVIIPASLKEIEAEAFMKTYLDEYCSIQNVLIAAGNSVFERDRQCIYNKTDKSLSVAVLDDKKEIYISDQIERLTESYSVLRGTDKNDFGFSVKKVVYPRTLKTVEGRGFHLLAASKTYFTGENAPQITGAEKYKHYALLPVFTEVYVPDAFAQIYKDWYKNYKCEEFINTWHTFQPEEKI